MSDDALQHLEAVLRDRLTAARAGTAPAGSYSVTLLTDRERAQRKIMEEAFELCLELGRVEVDRQRTASEAADLVFHVMAGLVGAGVAWDDVTTELAARQGTRPHSPPPPSTPEPPEGRTTT